MRHDEAMSYATRIAKLLVRGGQKIGGTKTGRLGFMSSVAVMVAARKGDPDAFDPAVKEVLLFGSTARGEDRVGDVDLILLDQGFYSNLFQFERETTQDTRFRARRDWYGYLRSNLGRMLEDFFGFSQETPEVGEMLEKVKTDLHVLPLSIFADPAKRAEIAGKHKDPQFFQNVFSKVLRFNFETETFEPVSLEYFAKYGDVSWLTSQVTA